LSWHSQEVDVGGAQRQKISLELRVVSFFLLKLCQYEFNPYFRAPQK